jgi:hypothetical protein
MAGQKGLCEWVFYFESWKIESRLEVQQDDVCVLVNSDNMSNRKEYYEQKRKKHPSSPELQASSCLVGTPPSPSAALQLT